MSEHQMALNYLWTRVVDAFVAGRMDEARECETLLASYEAMTSVEFDAFISTPAYA